MIDDLEKVDRLIAKLRQNLPLVATMSPELAAVVREESPDIGSSVQCRVARVDYSGDPGGIMCALDCKSPNGAAYVVSITHLSFDRRQPAAREIAAYQKHRLKRIRREMLLEDCPDYA
jgi:hypothetical protein